MTKGSDRSNRFPSSDFEKHRETRRPDGTQDDCILWSPSRGLKESDEPLFDDFVNAIALSSR